MADALPTGAATMSPAMGEMRAYPRYLFNQVAPQLGQRVWEIGVGYGTYTGWLREAGRSVLATDIDDECLHAVAARFAGDTQVRTARVDLTDERSIRACHDFAADSILCFNVLEHIEDHVRALRWMRDAVVPGARLGLIVPALPGLYGRMDSEAGHFRRYTRSSARVALEQAGWTVASTRYLNVVGALGWWYHNRWRRNAGLTDQSVNSQMRAGDAWLPRLACVTDPLFGRWAGLSVVAIGVRS